MKEKVLVNAFRSTLYTPDELLGAFDSSKPGSFADTLDFRVYREFIIHGWLGDASYSDTIVQSLHDNSISYAVRKLVKEKKVAAIMGGHRTPRDAEVYAQVAYMARELTRRGIVMSSGGGPGAMEATHLGASFANAPDENLQKAITILATEPELPHGVELVYKNGDINSEMMQRLHQWQVPAFLVAGQIKDAPPSLAIPTWHYGHEPPTPFATHIAKFFQNSLREDGLLAIATQGIIYTEGRAGTLQEVFQDAAQNYYQSFKWFSPMVFLGVKHWTETMPVLPVLKQLFKEKYDTHVLVTDDPDAAVDFVASFEAPEPLATLPYPPPE